ncbi:hypothetical protein HDZ31DRAFT_62896 [Schizophyllum fasciatum]
MSGAFKAIVKSVISGDSLVLRGKAGPQGQPPKERIVHLVDVVSPRLGSAAREDEPWAFEAREYLRAAAVGKEITFTSTHSLPPNDETPRDLGTADIGGHDLSVELTKAGWAKVKDHKGADEDPRTKMLRELENEARAAGKGLWNPHGPMARKVHYTMPEDSQAFLAEYKGKQLDAIVEQVRDGSTLRVRLLLDGEHQMANIALAGVRSPRTAAKAGEASEPFAEEAKFFVESRLLQRSVRVQILSLPSASAMPLQGNAAPTTATIFIGTVLHPAGNVAEFLVSAGLARIVDWHAGMLAPSGGMEKLRAAERTAKEKRLNLYASLPAPSAGKANGSAINGHPRNFEATVIRVWSADQLSLLPKDSKTERRVQLSSTRGPKPSDPRQAPYAQEAKEFLRKKLVGKQVKVTVDFIRPKEGDFDERECVTIRYGNQNANIAEQLIEKGLATALRHKRDDEDRSPDYDKLMAAEAAAVGETRGMHSGKDLPPPKQPLNISESAHRASQYVSGFKRQGKVPAVVEYVASGSRFRIFLPKDNQTLTLVLGGIRAPRTARNPSEKSEPYGEEAFEFSTRRYMQRDVEIEIDGVDKSGGFIGSLILNKTENAAVALVREGLATTHSSSEGSSWAKQLQEAENEARENRRNIWQNAEEKVEAAPTVDTSSALAPEYLDVIVSDGAVSSPPGFVPRGGDLVSARFSDGAWYRAKIRRSSPVKKEAEVTFIDYGNQDTVAFSNIRPLDPKFRSLPGQAHDARLSFVKLPAPDSEYHPEAVDRFRALCEGRKLIANIDQREGHLLHLRLIDPTDPQSAEDPLACINADLLRDGLATIDRKGCRYINAYPQVLKKLQQSINLAKRERLGMFEFGDIEDDE